MAKSGSCSLIILRISSVESPSEEMIDLRYLNDVTSSTRSPLIYIVVLGATLLLTMILLFSALIQFCKGALSFPALLSVVVAPPLSGPSPKY